MNPNDSAGVVAASYAALSSSSSSPPQPQQQQLGVTAAADSQTDATSNNYEFRRIFDQSLEQERQNVWDQLRNYAILLFAAIHLKSIEQDTSFFLVLVVFIAVFIVSSWIKAYLTSLTVQASQRGVPDVNRPLLSTFSFANTCLLVYITFLMVQTVMTRATPFLTEGHWSLENLMLPLAFGIILYAEWYFYTCRVAAESADVVLLLDTEPGGGGGAGAAKKAQ